MNLKRPDSSKFLLLLSSPNLLQIELQTYLKLEVTPPNILEGELHPPCFGSFSFKYP